MKKTFYVILFLVFSTISQAQVGVGTNDPKSVLDIEASNSSNPLPLDGLKVPSISAFPNVNPGVDQDGMLVFLNNSISGFKKGHYYWDNSLTQWESYGGEWRDGYDEDIDHLVFANQASKMDNEVVIFDDGSMGMGTLAPAENLEIKFTGANHGIQVTSASPPNAPNIIYYTKNGTLSGGAFLNNNNPIGGVSAKTWNGTERSQEIANIVFKADGNHSSGNMPTKYDMSVTQSGDDSEDDGGVEMTIKSNGNVGIGQTNPSATMHLKAGTSSNRSAPLKLTAGANLGTAEDGAIEYDGSNFYFTDNSSRKQILTRLGSTNTLNYANIGPKQSATRTITILGADVQSTCECSPVGSIERGLKWNCYVSAPNVVIIKISNLSNSPINPASRSWKTRVIN